MTCLADRFASEGERLSGTRFRLHGRDPATGLDCVGLAACALERAGGNAATPQTYSLRSLSIEGFLRHAKKSGFQTAAGAVQRGDMLLVRPGPAQHHLLVALGCGRFVHAHAGLRRVVVQPLGQDWPTLQHWRLTGV